MRIMDTFTKEQIQEIVKNNTSHKACLRQMGYKGISGDTVKAFQQKLFDLNISTKHFLLNGFTSTKSKIINPDKELFIENSPYGQSTLRRYYEQKYPQTYCSICNQSAIWNNKKLTFILDHINGKNRDDRLENLRWVCPNCNSQLPTTGARNPHRVEHLCPDCGKPLTNGAIRCMECSIKWRKNPENPYCTNRPNRDILKQRIRTETFEGIGREYGVSGNAVKKWCKWEHLPSTKKEIKLYSDEEWDKI